MEPYQIIQLLEKNNSRTEKERILSDVLVSNEYEFFIGAQLACDTLISFGIQKVPAIAKEDIDPTNLGTFTFQNFLDLADKLIKRQLTGNAAREAIETAALSCHGPSWNYFYRRILLKNLKCGVDEKTINKVLKVFSKRNKECLKYIIPVYNCQLAQNISNETQAKKVKGKKYLDYKLDGVRLQTILDKESNTVTQYTRNGKINDNFTLIRQGFEKLLPIIKESLVFDGEITAKSFQELMTQVNRLDNVDTSNARLAMFDVIPLKDFKQGKCNITQRDRHALLADMSMKGLFKKYLDDHAYVIPKIEVDLDTEEGRKSFDEFNKQALDAGYEGIMIKDPDAPYECKRSSAWIKKKPNISVTLKIINVEQGKPDGKRKDIMGAFDCKGIDENKEIETKVGTGFTDEQLEEFWLKRDKLIGMMVEIEADALTLEQGKTVWSLRFPRFKGFRGTIPGEKL